MEKRTAALLLLIALLTLGAAQPGASQGAQPHLLPKRAAPVGELDVIVATSPRLTAEARAQLDALLFDYDVFDLPLETLMAQVRSKGRLLVWMGSRSFDLELEPSHLLDPGYRRILQTSQGELEVPALAENHFRGTVAGEPGSGVRLSLTPSFVSGYVRTGEEWLFFDPLSDYADGASPSHVVVYREEDVRPEARGQCGSDHLVAAASSLAGLEPIVAASHNTLRRVDIATEADGEYYQTYGNPGTFDRILGILNAVDGIYRNQVNLYFNVTLQQAWTNPASDPYTASDAATTNTQFRNWWNANRSGVNRDVAHLFSGKSFTGGLIGYAYIARVCNDPTNAYGTSQDVPSSLMRTELMAHELGHNFAALHDDEIGCSGVSCNSSGPIMCSIIQSSGSNNFSSCSKNKINNHTHNHGACLN